MHWHVLVIDNNSKDQTREVVEGFCRRFPGRFSYVFERKQGKSYALNTGIAHATGDVIAFTDDDVQVDRHWLHNITAPLASVQWSGCAGRILPEAAFSAPPWLDTKARYSLAPLALFDPSISAGMIEEPPFGANMAYRREMFSKYGGFRCDLGPQPDGEIKNEDVEFGARLLAAGEQIWYERAAIVYHEVPAHRVRKSYFLSWWYGKGRSDTRELNPCGEGLCVVGVPLVLLSKVAVWTLRWLLAFHPARRFTCKTKVWGFAGNIAECFAQSRKAARLRISQPESTS